MVKLLSKAVFLISGLIIGHGLVDVAVVSTLISFLTENWEELNLTKAVLLKSVLEGLTSVLVIPIAHLSDSFRFGRFTIIIVSAIAYLEGLTLFWILNPYDDVWIFMVAGILVSIGQAARQPPLKAFLADQIREDDDKSGDPAEEHAGFIWGVLTLVMALIAIFMLGNSEWITRFMVSTIVIGSGLFSFLLGSKFYEPQNSTPSPVPDFLRVFRVAIMKRRLPYSDDPTAYFQNLDKEQLPLHPNIFFSRWLDKAALVVHPDGAEEEAARREVCTVAQVKDVKRILNLIPLWITLLFYGLVSVTGTTYFYEQSSYLDHRLGKVTVPIMTFYLIQNYSAGASGFLSERIVSTWFGEKRLRAEKVRIGLGMMCSFLSLTVAMFTERKRLSKIQNRKFIDEYEETVSMSVLYLTPQFVLMGMMEGLVQWGLEEFLKSQVSESMNTYGPPFSEFVIGIGKFSSIFWILTFSLWFGNSMENSHLDNYYGVLAAVSLLNLCFVYQRLSAQKFDAIVSDRDQVP